MQIRVGRVLKKWKICSGLKNMGASISQRPGKCLKNRRTKSEEYLGSKQNLSSNMGRFFTPWHNIISENIVDGDEDCLDGSKIVDYNDWKRKNFVSDMEKSFKEIHRSNSLDKSSLETDYEQLVIDTYADNCIVPDELSSNDQCIRRLTIDANKDSIFEVNLRKGSRGLGFSILEYDGFIFIKQLFPLEAASQSGLLQEGDIILSANGSALTNLSTFEALQMLRKLDNAVTLIVCRLQQFSLKKPLPSSQEIFSGTRLTYSGSQYKEIEIEMKKINGSLGFTLRKDEDGDRNHVVRALVKNPAISDGRIKPGDQIISVNGQDIGEMTHQEAVKFLRDCGDEVVLKLRKDSLSSSLTSLSSSHFENNNKTLRKEAIDMLNTLAIKKLKVDCDDKQNNNSKHERNLELHAESNTSDLKKRDSFFESRESLSSLSPENENLILELRQNASHLTSNLGEITDEPVSLPALDVGGDRINFQHSDPAYHSINVPNFTSKNSFEDALNQSKLSPVPPASKSKGLLKWKNVFLGAKDETKSPSNNLLKEDVVVELERRWNSRLGFSLGCKNGATIISAIHADSVAAQDGQLRVDDEIVEINGKNVESCKTSEIIELLRTVRGVVTIRVSRNCFEKP